MTWPNYCLQILHEPNIFFKLLQHSLIYVQLSLNWAGIIKGKHHTTPRCV